MATYVGHSGDSIDQLQTDTSQPSDDELQIIDALFKKRISTMSKLFNSAKDAIAAGLLFVILSLPPVTALIESFLPVSKSAYMMILIKAVILIIFYFVISRMYLVRARP